MEVQSIHPLPFDNEPLATTTHQVPVVVTPTKDTTASRTHNPNDNSVTPDDEVIPSASASKSIDKVDTEGDTIPVVEELEIDPASSIATSTSASPLLVPKDPTVEKVVTSTKKRPTNNHRNSTSSSVTPSSSKSAKRPTSNYEKATSTITSPSAVAKNWKQASMVNAELAALKQRGLAKMLNQHFTSTAQQLAIEKAAADAAILDLQERKARTREFIPTNSSEISPLDQACIQANKWRAECRRKERETLLLYQQYVHKFGPTTILPVPTVPSATKAGVDGTKQVVAPTAPMVPPQPAMSRPTPTLVPSMTAQIEQTLEVYCARGAVAHPSILTHGREETYSSVAAKEEHTFREYYRKQLEAKGVDAVCSPGFYKGDGTASDVFAQNDVYNEKDINNVGQQQEDWNKDDICSIVSGLTTLHSAMTREFIYDCENSVQTFLRDEQATVRKLLEEEEDHDASSSGDTHVSNVLIVQDSDATAKAAENMVQQMQEILQEYQMKHVGAGSTNETIVDDTLVVEKKYPIAYPTKNDDEKWVIYYDEFYRQEYYHEVHTNRTQWDPPGKKSNNRNDPPDSSFSNSHSTDAYSVMNGGDGLGGSLYDDLGLYHDDDRMDRIIESNNHRVAAYRKRQRRKRLRRRLIATIILIMSVLIFSGGAYYHSCYQDGSNKPSACSVIDNIVTEQWNQLNDLVMYKNNTSTIPDVMTELEQCMLQLTDEFYFIPRPQQVTIEVCAERVEIIRRPWGCNIPLAYLFHSKCRRMASLQPIFDLQALVNSMLQ